MTNSGVGRSLIDVRAWAVVWTVTLHWLVLATGVGAQEDVNAKIGSLEKQLKAKGGAFDWQLHNELRHLYLGVDDKKSFYHIDIILRHRVMDDYTLDVLGARGADKAPAKAVADLLAAAVKHPEYRFVTAACLLKAAELTSDAAQRKQLRKRLAALLGDDLEGYRGYPFLPAATRALLNQANVLDAQAEQLYQQAKLPAATVQRTKALELYRRAFPKDEFPQGHSEVAGSLNNLGFVLQAQREYAKAEPFFREALAMYEALYPSASGR
jgi:tetratricopeptide (TPR) repeat protein